MGKHSLGVVEWVYQEGANRRTGNRERAHWEGREKGLRSRRQDELGQGWVGEAGPAAQNPQRWEQGSVCVPGSGGDTPRSSRGVRCSQPPRCGSSREQRGQRDGSRLHPPVCRWAHKQGSSPSPGLGEAGSWGRDRHRPFVGGHGHPRGSTRGTRGSGGHGAAEWIRAGVVGGKGGTVVGRVSDPDQEDRDEAF